MPEYHIQRKISILAKLYDSYDYKGFHFEPFSNDMVAGPKDGWVVSKTIDVDNVDAAFNSFNCDFFPLLDKISFVTQCYAAIEWEPFLVKREDRAEFFLLHSKGRNPVPLSFGKKERESLEKLEKYEEKGDPFYYLGEAINASQFCSRLPMLTSALEGIAGEKGKNSTNHRYIKNKILKDNKLHKKIFNGGSGIRNQILHGKKIDDGEHGNIAYNDIIYKKIINYFNSKHGTNINTEIINAPRNITGNHQYCCMWLKPKSGKNDIDFRELCEFTLNEITENLEWVSQPDNY